MRLHHVQVACPPGGEDGARRFYADGLGMTEVEKPEDLRARGGWFAFQVPGNFGEPSHTIRTDLAAEVPYAEHTRGVAVPSSHHPAVYLEALATLGCRVDAWETTYLHVLSGPDPVFTWVSGTGARPTLQALPDDLRPGFEDEFKRRLRTAYPERDGRVVLPFRRIFVVAEVPGA